MMVSVSNVQYVSFFLFAIASGMVNWALCLGGILLKRARGGRNSDEEWGNFHIGEEDSEDDAYDRMVMG